MRKALLTAVLVVLLVSCTPKNAETLNYRIGTEGLVVSFAKDSPPATVYRDSKLMLILEVKNKGAYTKQASLGNVYLHGLDPNAIFLEGYDTSGKYAYYPIPETPGKNAYMMDGGYNFIEIAESGPVKVPFGDTTDQKIMATTCYEYQTLATPTVCVVSSPTVLYKDRVCDPKSVTLTNQGAPMAVVKVDEQAMENMVSFMVTVQNVGGGRVVSLDSLASCPLSLTHQNTNIVDFQVSLSNYKADCTPSDGKVRLVDGKGTFFCRFPVETLANYESQLNIILNYGYSASVTRAVKIANPPGTTYTPPAAKPNTGSGSGSGTGTGTTYETNPYAYEVDPNYQPSS